jgi:fumarate hydratase class II
MVADEIIAGELNDHFPLVIWQTGSGTHTNMNCNEVIANRAQFLVGGTLNSANPVLHPNDDVNKAQSSNDTFSAAMQIAAYKKTIDYLIPKIKLLRDTFEKKSQEFWDIVKIGRTHCMDATPITLGQEISGYVAHIDNGINAIKSALPKLAELPLGGTAVGTGINAPENFDNEITSKIVELTGYPFVTGKNKFAMLAGHDAIVQAHSAIKQLALSFMKIANDLRMLASGPNAGLAEIILPANEPGSSIMPGKVNPTQIEALTMVCAQVIGNDTTIAVACSNGQFELNVFKPVIIANYLQSASLMADACKSFNDNCAVGIKANLQKINTNVERSLMLVTALTDHIGYEKSAKIAQKAYKEGISLKESAVSLGIITEAQFDEWVNPGKMTNNS